DARQHRAAFVRDLADDAGLLRLTAVRGARQREDTPKRRHRNTCCTPSADPPECLDHDPALPMAQRDYTPESNSTFPVLSPNRSMGTPILSRSAMCRFASGVSSGYLMCLPPF